MEDWTDLQPPYHLESQTGNSVLFPSRCFKYGLISGEALYFSEQVGIVRQCYRDKRIWHPVPVAAHTEIRRVFHICVFIRCVRDVAEVQ